MNTPGRASSSAADATDAVVTHHRDGFRSGVARFNELLAERLGVPLLGLAELAGRAPRCPLLSFKVSELGEEETQVRAALDARDGPWELFLHEYLGLELEQRLVAGARGVHCGNDEILAAVGKLSDAAHAVWTPGLLLDDRRFRPAEISVFSFGMAHKLRIDAFRRLRALLEQTGSSYVVYVSAANHETASLRDSESVFREMHEVFPQRLYFLGNLSDVAVSNYLATSTFFAAFFERGVRANNTTVASAMERGAVVITNLDRYSPTEFVHMENVIDIGRCGRLPSDPLLLRRIGLRAMETARARGWDALAVALR
jgi:hypothetical protein